MWEYCLNTYFVGRPKITLIPIIMNKSIPMVSPRLNAAALFYGTVTPSLPLDFGHMHRKGILYMTELAYCVTL
jgi:hypothetical protein